MSKQALKIEKMVYELRDKGAFPELECKVTGAKWNSDKHDNFVLELLTLRRLALKHRRLAEMGCNGEGCIRGKHYTTGNIGYENSHFINAYHDSDTSIFDTESEKVSDKIKAICDRLGLRVEFQGDPRGYTVKVFKGDRFLDIQA